MAIPDEDPSLQFFGPEVYLPSDSGPADPELDLKRHQPFPKSQYLHRLSELHLLKQCSAVLTLVFAVE